MSFKIGDWVRLKTVEERDNHRRLFERSPHLLGEVFEVLALMRPDNPGSNISIGHPNPIYTNLDWWGQTRFVRAEPPVVVEDDGTKWRVVYASGLARVGPRPALRDGLQFVVKADNVFDVMRAGKLVATALRVE